MDHLAIYGLKITIDSVSTFLKILPQEYSAYLIPKNILLFSEKVLEQITLNDQIHEKNNIVNKRTREFKTYSSGEKKQLLFQHILQKNPQCIILDNPFESVDKQNVMRFQNQLESFAENGLVIQLFTRKEDLLPFINTVGIIDQNNSIRFIDRHEFLNMKFTYETLIQPIPISPMSFSLADEEIFYFKNVNVSYQSKPILQDITWRVKKGEFWELRGPNGVGKTTILSMIFGDNPKAYGENIWLFGIKKGSGESVWDVKKKIGYFSPSIIEGFTRRQTVRKMVLSGLKDTVGLYTMASSLQNSLADEWLSLLQLQHKRDKAFVDLPIHEQRLIMIARAMIKTPPLLILDEVTANLTDKTAMKIVDLVNRIARDTQTAIIYVSHRNEPLLNPDYIYELTPFAKGAKGVVIH